jgi:hypothetical protein
MLDGAELIRLERERQLTECKHTPQHDDTEHANGDFAVIAAGLLCHGTAASVTDQKLAISLRHGRSGASLKSTVTIQCAS